MAKCFSGVIDVYGHTYEEFVRMFRRYKQTNRYSNFEFGADELLFMSKNKWASVSVPIINSTSKVSVYGRDMEGSIIHTILDTNRVVLLKSMLSNDTVGLEYLKQYLESFKFLIGVKTPNTLSTMRILSSYINIQSCGGFDE